MFLNTCRAILRNPGVRPLPALIRHAVWHGVRQWSPLPLKVSLTDRSILQLTRREEMNGSVALAWSQRLYDYHNMTFLRTLLAAGFAKVCFDIGANIGIYTLLMSEQESVIVHAFEPHPATHQTLERMLQYNGRHNTHAWQMALSDAAGSLLFTNDDCSTVNQALEHGAEPAQGITVPCETGLDFCERQQTYPDIIKIDTEGFETRVLSGFGKCLDQTRLIFVEMNASVQALTATLPPDLFLGPFYVDATSKRLLKERHNHEDAVFVNRDAVTEIQDIGFRI